MQALQSISKRILAALTMFTRLPLWRLCNIEAEYYKQVVPLWPLAGWLTGGLMVGICILCQWVGVPVGTCVALCLAGRILLTGALHEDGFADFCDGFGGGTSRDAVLRIMKDSHIGTYGVLGLVMYYLIIWNTLTVVLGEIASAVVLVVADSVCKLISSSIIWFLPYARKESEAKILTVSHGGGRQFSIRFVAYVPVFLPLFHRSYRSISHYRPPAFRLYAPSHPGLYRRLLRCHIHYHRGSVLSCSCDKWEYIVKSKNTLVLSGCFVV